MLIQFKNANFRQIIDPNVIIFNLLGLYVHLVLKKLSCKHIDVHAGIMGLS